MVLDLFDTVGLSSHLCFTFKVKTQCSVWANFSSSYDWVL